MENVVLIIHLLLALSLIGVVLLQNSEGGGLGMGGGGGGGASATRPGPTALGKVTWVLAIGFICTSITLTILSAQKSAGSSVIDRLGVTSSETTQSAPIAPTGDDLLPPSADNDAPLVPRAD